jgi:porin
VGGSFWQYISTKEPHEGPLNLSNRQQDLAGWGIFGRLTLADDDTNPWKTSIALGLGARGVIPSRPNDMFGVGYFYNGLSKKGFVEKIDDGQGFEAYYNMEIVPSVRLSFNLQWLNTIRPSAIIASVDDTWMFSTRLQVVF